MKISNILKDHRLYIDLDGVLVDFDNGAKRMVSKHIDLTSKMPEEETKKLNSVKFWKNLQWTHDGKMLWEYVKHYNPIILSAYPSYSWGENSKENAEMGKKLWIRENLNGYNKYLIVHRSEKADHAVNEKNQKSNVLVDDYHRNIKEWQTAGGIPVLHVATKSTIEKLSELGF